MPKPMIQDEARLLLEACYGGPWKMIAALLSYHVRSALHGVAFQRWEWVRRRVLRRVPDPALEIADRVADEERAVSKLVNDL